MTRFGSTRLVGGLGDVGGVVLDALIYR